VSGGRPSAEPGACGTYVARTGVPIVRGTGRGLLASRLTCRNSFERATLANVGEGSRTLITSLEG